ncbi:MAG: sulfatase-like hydrolase/transferase, partial [Pedosphaera parvula]|nr:sulfatase-like hydrolase/transferase [Pedosphaera parvula]
YWNVGLYRNETVIERPANQHTLTRRYTEEAIKFIQEHKQGPFFVYFPHTFPHVPLFASDKFNATSRRGLYGDVVEELDCSVGQIFNVLRQEKLTANTFVFFTSDNGPWLIQGDQGGSAGLLREGKGSTWEGGMREPGIAWWPGRIKAGAVTGELASTMDLYTTCLTLAGVPVPQDRVVDGVDMAPILFHNGRSNRDVYFYYRGTQLYAVRKGPYKAHYLTRSAYGKDPVVKHDPPALYHLGHDPSEQFDVSKDHPEVLADIAREVARHQAKLVPGKPQLEEILPVN